MGTREHKNWEAYSEKTGTRLTPFVKSNGRFCPDKKNNMMPSPNLYDFCGCVNYTQVVISFAKYIDFLH